MLSLELVAVVLTLLAVYLTVRQIIWCWPLAMVSVTLYAVVFYDARLYADMGLQGLYLGLALLHGPEQIADLPVPVAESPGAVRIGHPERSHLVEYLAPNSVFNSLPRQRSSPHLRPDDRLVTIDRVLHHASLGEA